MNPSHCLEAVDLALEVVNLVASLARPRATSAETTLESLAFDDLDKLCVAEEITGRWHREITEREQRDWHSVRDVAETIARVRGRVG